MNNQIPSQFDFFYAQLAENKKPSSDTEDPALPPVVVVEQGPERDDLPQDPIITPTVLNRIKMVLEKMGQSIKSTLGNSNTVEVLLFLLSGLLSYLSFLNEKENVGNDFSSGLESKKEEAISVFVILSLKQKWPSLQAFLREESVVNLATEPAKEDYAVRKLEHIEK